jgi:hypothetical protein
VAAAVALQLVIVPELASGSPATTTASDAHSSVVGADADQLGTNWYPNAGVSPAQVNAKDFGQLYDLSLPPVGGVPAGQIYAQPIVTAGVLLVVTEDNNAYGLNPATGAVEWSRNFGAAWPSTTNNCGDLAPSVGITGTPVVDTATGIAYFTTDTAPGHFEALWRMQAVHVASGKEVAKFPVAIKGAATNLAGRSFDPVFNPVYQGQRPGLAFVDGEVYAAFGSDCDFSRWYGWIAGVTSTGALKNMWVDESKAGQDGAGIWGPGGIVVDSAGNLYVATGNGGTAAPGPGRGVPQPSGLGECVIKLATTGGRLKLADYFCPSDAALLNTYDGDLGSGSPTGLPASFGTPKDPDLLVEAGKSGEVYLLNRNNLGGVDQGPSGGDDVVSETGPRGGVWSHPAVWPGDGGYVYITTSSPGATGKGSGNSGELDVYQRVVSDGAVSLNWVGHGPTTPFGTGAPIVTSDGTDAGSAVVWDIIRTGSAMNDNAANLVAFAAVPVAGSINNPAASLPVLWKASVGNSTKFNPPLAYDGKIFVANFDGQILAFGPRPTAPPLTGAALAEPDTVVGEHSAATATFTAAGKVTVRSASVSVSTTGAAGAFTTPRLSKPVPLTAGRSIRLPVSFDPEVVGGQKGTLTLTTNLGTVSVLLSGRGIAEGVPIDATPPSVYFGIQPIGGGAVQDTVSFENTSTSSFTVDSVGIESGAPAPFAVLPTPLPTVAAGASFSVTVDFTPPATSGDFVQTFNDHLVLDTSAGEATVPLEGQAAPPAQITISSLKLAIGTVAIGQSGIVSFTVGNRGGAPLIINKSKPPIADGFSAVTSLPEGTRIQAHQSFAETVRFSPKTAGHFSATWVITGDDGSGPQTVTFTGIGAKEHTIGSPTQAGWKLSGKATLSGDHLQLTPAVRDVAGAAFSDVAISPDGLRASFTADLTGGTGGSGLTFALVGTPAAPSHPGLDGPGLGLAGLPAVAVALQSYPSAQNPSRNSVGVVTSVAGATAFVWRRIVNPSSSLRVVPVQVTIIISGKVMSVAIDGFTVIDTAVTLPKHVHLGFTGATGKLTDRHVISAVQLSYP